MAADLDHARIVDAMLQSHDKRMLDALQELENRIAAYTNQAPVQDGKLFDLAWSLRARQDIDQIIRETFITEADALIREYPEIADSVRTMFQEYEAFFGIPDDVVINLQRQTFAGFQAIAVTFQTQLADSLYRNTIIGVPVDELVKELRQSINGVYIQSDQAEIQRLVEIANAGGDDAEEAVRKLHQKYASDRTGNNMRRYARQMVHDSLMQFDASINVAAGKEIGADRWKYYGGIVERSRDWCIKHKGNTFSEDEIRELWSNNNWQGKAPGDPFLVRGGYNCQHHWRPVFSIEV